MPNVLAKKYTITDAATQGSEIDEMFDDLYRQLSDTNVTGGDAGALGSFLRTGVDGGEWSTLVLPNAAVKGSIAYASATDVVSMLADIATGNALLSGGVGVAPAWGKIGLTTHVTGVLPVANGGTGAGAFTAGSVVFAGAAGVYTQDNANLFWDDGNNRLGVGIAVPIETIDVRGATPDIGLRHANTGDYAAFRLYEGSTQKAIIQHVGSTFVTAARQDHLELFNLSATGAISFWTNSLLRGAIYASGGAAFLGTVADPGAGIFGIDGSFKLYNTTAATGVTLMEVRAGAGQNTVPTAQFKLSRNDGVGTFYVFTDGGAGAPRIATATLNLQFDDPVHFASRVFTNSYYDTAGGKSRFTQGDNRAAAQAAFLWDSIDAVPADAYLARWDEAGVIKMLLDGGGNLLLGTSTLPTAGTSGLIFGDGTALSGMGSNTAGLFGNDNGGTVDLYAINEAGVVTRLSGTSGTYTPTNVTTDRSYDANATTLDEVADVLGTLIADLQARGILA